MTLLVLARDTHRHLRNEPFFTFDSRLVHLMSP
jgi:hypothetical protein